MRSGPGDNCNEHVMIGNLKNKENETESKKRRKGQKRQWEDGTGREDKLINN